MDDDVRAGGLSGFVSSVTEQVAGRIARDVLDNPTLGAMLGRALEARSKAVQAQEAALGVLNVPSAGDIERLTRRVRSMGERLGGIEDALIRIEAAVRRHADQLAGRLDTVEKELLAARRQLADLESSRAEEPTVVSRNQEVLAVRD
jgi:hypothetical protein